MSSTDEPEVGIPEIDRQHAEIFSLQNKICGLLEEGAGQDRLMPEMDRLSEIMDAHLLYEVGMMEQAEYDELEGHAKRHEAVREAFARVAEKIRRDGAGPFNLAAFRIDVVETFCAHVINCDQKMAHELGESSA
ncbi:MAG: hypothetical protein JXR97_00035 [Planctomycetes bacterium]|nr:hypothetical protein [Planctomycetota bacterium]